MEIELLTPTAPTWTPSFKRITFEEYLDSLTEESKGDLIDGVLHMQSPPSDAHEEIFGFLFDILRNYVLEKKLGVVRGSRTTPNFFETTMAFGRRCSCVMTVFSIRTPFLIFG